MARSSDPAERVVVTGLGCVSPLGRDVPSVWEAASAGRSGCGEISLFDTTGFTSRLGAEVPGEVELEGVGVKEARRMDRVVRFALAAAGEALNDAALEVDDATRDRIGVAIGSGIGGLGTLIANHKTLLESGPRRVSPFTIPMSIANMPGGAVSVQHGLRGPNLCHVTACASGSHAIGESAKLLALGEADVMLAGGAEAPIVDIAVAGFAAMRALSTRNDDPTAASRPFDLGRDGFVIGEGAGLLVLETLAHARERGARVRAEVLGYGASADGFHLVAPDGAGGGAARCMRAALASAGLVPEDVDYVNAHATSTPAGDPAEVRALRTVFGGHLDRLPVSATKSLTGHLLGAAGALEALLCVCALETGLLPPTINLDDPDPACALDHVAGKARQASPSVVLSNSFGFGGTNSSLILAAVD